MPQGAQGVGEPQPPATFPIEMGTWWDAIKVRPQLDCRNAAQTTAQR